jgi:hypothetical protein
MRLVAVTRELRTAGTPLSRFFHERFPNVAPMVAEFDSRLVGATTLYPPADHGQPPYATLGTAIDYRLLYYFWAKPYRALDAFKGARTSFIGNPRDTACIPWQAVDPTGGMTQVPRLVRDFFDGLEQTLAATNPVCRCLSAAAEERLCRYCYVLALFDEVYRHGGVPLPAGSPLIAFQGHETAEVADLLALADPWLGDLCQLSWLFYARGRRMFSEHAWIHPKNVWRMAGAEADLLVSGYVIDFKTTIKPRLDPGGSIRCFATCSSNTRQNIRCRAWASIWCDRACGYAGDWIPCSTA